LDTIRAKLANDLKTFEQELEEAREDDNASEVKNLETKISVIKKSFRVAELRVELYSARQTLSKELTDESKMAVVANIEKDLKEAESKLPKAKAPQTVPPVTVTETSGAKRTSTFLSLTRRNTRSKDETNASPSSQ
jgi:hypothetical protein